MALHYKDGDYILVRWPGLPDSQSTLLHFPADGDIECLAECIDDGHDLEATVLAHGNSQRLAYVLAQRAERAQRQAEAQARRNALPLRARLDSFVAGLAPGDVFRTPAGRLGRVAGIGKAWATWHPLDAIPDGVEVIELMAEADEQRLCRYL